MRYRRDGQPPDRPILHARGDGAGELRHKIRAAVVHAQRFGAELNVNQRAHAGHRAGAGGVGNFHGGARAHAGPMDQRIDFLQKTRRAMVFFCD